MTELFDVAVIGGGPVVPQPQRYLRRRDIVSLSWNKISSLAITSVNLWLQA